MVSNVDLFIHHHHHHHLVDLERKRRTNEFLKTDFEDALGRGSETVVVLDAVDDLGGDRGAEFLLDASNLEGGLGETVEGGREGDTAGGLEGGKRLAAVRDVRESLVHLELLDQHVGRRLCELIEVL